MLNPVTVDHHLSDGLICDHWVFTPTENQGRIEITLSIFKKFSRKSKRHKFSYTGIGYFRCDPEKTTVNLSDLEIPITVKVAAIEQFQETLKVTK